MRLQGAKYKKPSQNRIVLLLLASSLVLFVLRSRAFSQLPTELPQVRFNSGQNIAPYFEGWIRNPDGTFDLVFGYFNRNWKEELVIDAGLENSVEPSGPNQGQPTYFLPRRQRWVYRLRVPADFGNKEVVWTVTAHGKTEKAYGNLLPAQEINDRVVMSNGNLDPGEGDPNEPPSIKIAQALNATVSAPVGLSATVVDDGLPKPRAARVPRAATSAFGAQVDRADSAPPKRLSVTWMQYGGPGKVTFDQAGPIPVTDNQAATTAHFSQPGVYRLRAIASDGALSTTSDLIITVK